MYVRVCVMKIFGLSSLTWLHSKDDNELLGLGDMAHAGRRCRLQLTVWCHYHSLALQMCDDVFVICISFNLMCSVVESVCS